MLIKDSFLQYKTGSFKIKCKFTTFLKNESLSQLKTYECIFKDPNNDLYLEIHYDDDIMMGRESTKLKNS